jgi:hypothetical protein
MSYWLREVIVPPNHAPLTCATYETLTLLYTLPGLGSKLRTRKVKPWTAEEARQFLESAKRDQDPLYAAYVPILVIGLRKGEVVGLPRSAVNLDRAESDIGDCWPCSATHSATKTAATVATLSTACAMPLHTCVRTSVLRRRSSSGRFHVSGYGVGADFMTNLGSRRALPPKGRWPMPEYPASAASQPAGYSAIP